MDAFGLDGLDELVRALIADGHRVIGPRLRDNAIVLDDIAGVADLPSGWGVEVAPGRYRVHRRDDDALFGHSAGPQSWKQFVHPPRRKLWETTEDGYAAAKNCAEKILRSVWNTHGTLDGLRVIKVLGCVNSTLDFIEQHLVINGCSDLLHEIFGKEGDGYHARSALGFAQLPTGAAVEVEAIFEIKS